MTEANAETIEDRRERLVSALTSLGSAWARYGLTVGRTALENSARSLQITATALGKLADTIDARTDREQDVEDDRSIAVDPPRP
jgi:hypothetical protein